MRIESDSPECIAYTGKREREPRMLAYKGTYMARDSCYEHEERYRSALAYTGKREREPRMLVYKGTYMARDSRYKHKER